MPLSVDEAFFGFVQDAPPTKPTNFFLATGDTTYSRTSGSTDSDAFTFATNFPLLSNLTYTVSAGTNTGGFLTTFEIFSLSTNQRVGVSGPSSFGFATFTFTPTEVDYLIVTSSSGPGIYSLRVDANFNEGNSGGTGEAVSVGVSKSSVFNFRNDLDTFRFVPTLQHTYSIEFDRFLSFSVNAPSISPYTYLPLTNSSLFVRQFVAPSPDALLLKIVPNNYDDVGSYRFLITDVSQIRSVGGTTGSDTIVGTAADEDIQAGAGYDSVTAGAGNDTANGGAGQSYLRGDDGNDSLLGGADFDDLNGNMGNDTISTGAGEDYCVGGKDNDSLSGGADYDLVYGNLGDDTCNGDDGNDIVRGGQGNDVVNGGAGNDFVSGDKGDDTMIGGTGADSFHTFGDAGIDRVIDFSLAQGDRVQFDPGTQFSVAQSGADTVITMTGGGQMILVGISMSSLVGNSWFFGN